LIKENEERAVSSEKTPEKGKQSAITRSKQSRRKVLKSMAAGSGAVIAGKSMPDQWAKPMVDSVLLPSHAQTSAVCTIIGSVSATSGFFDGADSGLDSITHGPFALPGSYDTIATTTAAEITVTPQITVTPGVTDAFNLTTVITGDFDVNAADLNQNVTPDPANGTIAFNSMTTAGYDDGALFEMVLTPVNSSFCGGPQVININFID
jgi:hypothetical protein